MARPIPNIITTALDLMTPMPAPTNFKLASILTVISTLLGRRVWLDNDAELPRCYPNLYTMLVAPPGIGKDIVISWARDILSELQEYLGPQNRVWASAGTSISPKGIYDALGSTDHCEQTFRYGGKPHAFRSLTFLIGEMSTIMPDYDQKLIGVLNDLYNCGPHAADRIRGQEVFVPNPHVTMLIGNQPATLFETLPEKAFHMGFTSRLCIWVAREKTKRKLFGTSAPIQPISNMRSALIQSLHDVTLMSGPFVLTPEAASWLNDFHETDPYAVPGTRWQDYNPRRILHVTKLAMICSAAERSDRQLQVAHCEHALTYMRAYEQDLPHLFDGVVSSQGFSAIFEDLYKICETHAKPIIITRHDGTEVLSHYEVAHITLTRELSRTISAHNLEKLMAELIRAGILTPLMIAVDGAPPIPVLPRVYIYRPNL